MTDRVILVDNPEEFARETGSGQDGRLALDGHDAGQGLAKLVLTLIEMIRQLLERQALHRMERGTLSDLEIERIGETLGLLEEKLEELCVLFGLKRTDLNVDLGPLGNIL
jgi:CRISPR/Cas system-associated endonuclease Cas1